MYKHVERRYLPEFVYGGIDGAITTLAIIAGAIGAVLSPAIILILGFANLVADGFSMGVSNYLSTQSKKELHRKHKDATRYKIQAHQAIKNGLATFISFIIIGFIPLFPFVVALFIPEIKPYKFILSIVLTGVALLIVGGIRGKVVEKSISKSAIQTLLIGGVAASLAFMIGYLLRGLAG
jgi:vacuolar iron transporter family protein